MLINGKEFELDIFDADEAERYETAVEKLQSTAKALEGAAGTEGVKLSNVIRQQCECIFEFFNTLFGDGTDKLIFGEKTNIYTCMDVSEEFMQDINKQREKVEARVKKYSPNRAQRRT